MTPMYAVSLLEDASPSPKRIDALEKGCGAILAVVASCTFFLFLRCLVLWPAAMGGALLFGLATNVASTISQGLWSFSGEMVFLTLGLYTLARNPDSSRKAAVAGALLSAAFLCRPTALIAAASLLGLMRSRRQAVVYASALALGCGMVCLFLWSVYGHPLGGYGIVNQAESAWGPSAVSLLGTLVSPSRGLLPFFPYLLLAPLAFLSARSTGLLRLFAVSASAVLGYILLAASYTGWSAGWSFGPRLLTEAAPFQVLLVLPLSVAASRSWVVWPLVAAGLVSGTTQGLGIYRPVSESWNRLMDDDPKVIWDARRSQIAAAWGVFAPRVSFPGRQDETLTGGVDAPAEGGTVQGELVVTGWARIPGEDLKVHFLIDGELRVPGRLERYARPDVGAAVPAIGSTPRTGFEARFPFHRERAGDTSLVVVFEAAGGRVRRYPRIAFRWLSGSP